MAIQIKTPFSIRLGVIGAGTMGSGIALTALQVNMAVTLYDISAEMLEQARGYIEKHLERKDLQGRMRSLTLTSDWQDVAGSGVVIEAVPEDLAVKEQVFARLDEVCPPPVILATNTSTLPVTAIASASGSPERVGGMHFFNPAPVLPLVEIVRGAQTSSETISTLIDLARMLGKTPVVTKDTPGFIVNRVARPFYGEALRLLGEGTTGHVVIDRLVRMGGGFKMGPFELMDLIGIDVNLAATESMYQQTFYEPRYRPHPIQLQMVHRRTLGRKSGQGFYTYDPDHKIEDLAPPRQKQRRGGALLVEEGDWAPGLVDLVRQAGYRVAAASINSQEPFSAGLAMAGRTENLETQVVELDRRLPLDIPLLVQCADVTLTEAATWMQHPERLVGFDGLFIANGPAATLVANPIMTPAVRARVEEFITSLGRIPIWIGDTPGLVLPRIIAMLVNEAAFAFGEGVADMETIDEAMRLGVNYPRGPLAWGKHLGYSRVVGVLDHLHREYGEERYRCSPLLRRWERLERVIS